MPQTLYDILELSPQASPQAIEAAFERLRTAYLEDRLDGGPLDADSRFKLIKDAYHTLSHAELRARYDARLNPPAPAEALVVYAEPEKMWIIAHGWKWALVLVIALSVVLYLNTQKKLEAERLRLIEQAQQASREAAARAQAQREAYAEQQREQQARYREQQELAEQERLRIELERQSARVSSELAAAERDSRREAERRQRELENQRRQAESQLEYQRRQEAAEAQRRLDREKALLRQLERDNGSDATRTGGIPARSDSSSARPGWPPY